MSEEKQVAVVEEKKDEKKEDAKKEDTSKNAGDSSFKKWWKQTKKNVSDSFLEDHIKDAFRKSHHPIDVYAYGSFFNESEESGAIENNVLLYYGKDVIAPYSVIIDSKDGKAYYALESKPAQVQVTYESTLYTRDATSVTLDPNVTTVEVVKTPQKYYLYKGKVEKK
jgi:hypothetical protein